MIIEKVIEKYAGGNVMMSAYLLAKIYLHKNALHDII